MAETKKYWIEMLQDFFSTNTEDEKIILDDYDAADYLQMAMETVTVDVINKRYKGVSVQSMANWYRNIPVDCKSAVLPFRPILNDAGIVTMTVNGSPIMPREEGVQSVAFAILKPKSVIPTYVVDGVNVTFEYPPSFDKFDVFMIPYFVDLQDDSEFKMAAGVKDIVFNYCMTLAAKKMNFKPNYKNNTHVGDQPV